MLELQVASFSVEFFIFSRIEPRLDAGIVQCWQGVSCEFQAPGRVTSLSLQPSSPSEKGVLVVKRGVRGAGDSLGDLVGLKFLVLAQVRFSFQHPVPAALAKLMSLETLGLSGTEFVGTTLPSFLSALPKLNDVTVEGNRFPDGIPVRRRDPLHPASCSHSLSRLRSVSE
jgi:hypothetical protein